MGTTAIATTTATDLTSPQLLTEFLQWIDRGEKTTQTYITNLRQFAAWLKMQRITAPTRQDIISYRQWLESEHESIKLADTPAGWEYRTDKKGKRITVTCKATTVSTYMQSVKQLFRWLASCGVYPNVADNVHIPKIVRDEHARDELTPEEIRHIEETILAQEAAAIKDDNPNGIEQAKRLRSMMLLAATAGLRTIELSRANVDDLTARGGQYGIYVWGKGHASADTYKPLAREVYAAVKDYLSYRRYDGQALFTATGSRSGGKRIAARTIGQLLKKGMQAAGYDSARLTAHSLRHSAGTAAMAVSGSNIYMAQKYMRHADPKTTEIYTHCDDMQDQSKMAQDIYDYLHGDADEMDAAAQLQKSMGRMTPQQLAQLNQIAAAMLA